MLARKSVLWRAYKTKRTRSAEEKYMQCSVECSEAISDYYRNKEVDIIKSNNIGSFYKYVNNCLSHKGRIPSFKKSDGSMANTDMEKAELLQEGFKSVFSTDDFCNPVMDRLVKPNVHLSDVDFTPDLVFKALSTIKCNSACGPDRMSPRLLFMLKQPLSVPLSLVFGALFPEGVLPNEWLEANIIPVFKKGLASDPNNRPILLACCYSRIMEKVITDVILKYLLSNKLINRSQHCFLARHSTVS